MSDQTPKASGPGMIECPECEGRGDVDVTTVISTEPEWSECYECDGTGRIPDRRKPTANDRAVERLKELMASFIQNERPWDEPDNTARIVLDIIDEEANRE